MKIQIEKEYIIIKLSDGRGCAFGFARSMSMFRKIRRMCKAL